MLTKEDLKLARRLSGFVDRRDKAELLSQILGGYWTGGHPNYTRQSWQEAVASNNTIEGYWTWVLDSMDYDGKLFIEDEA